MKKLLFITYDFPPACTSGIYRPVKFVKYLREFGWEPVVLTAKNPYVEAFDNTLMKDIPEGTKIARAFSIDLSEINDKIYEWLFGKPQAVNSTRLESLHSTLPYKSSIASSVKIWIKRNILSRINVSLQNWLYIPDSKVGWFPFALFRAIRLIVKEKPDVICTYLSSSNYPICRIGTKISIPQALDC